MTVDRPSLLGLSRVALSDLIRQWGFKPVHAQRVWRHVHAHGRDDVDAIEGLPGGLIDRLRAETALAWLPVARETVSSDGFTRKFLLGLDDGRQVETVLMRYAGRVTACVSTQAGCAMGCVFCATGQMGFTRHLTTAEIVAQVLHIARTPHSAPRTPHSAPRTPHSAPRTPHSALRTPHSPPRTPHSAPRTPHSALRTAHSALRTAHSALRTAHSALRTPHSALRNVVLMGMGEPLHNYDATIAATQILCDTAGLALSPSRMTLSTVGVIPGIIRLADERQPISLAVSLHAATQDARVAIVPVATKWPLNELMEACRYYCDAMDRHIFYEWTLIEGANDRADDAHALGALLRTQRAHVNLIPLNPTAGYDGAPTQIKTARAFQTILAEYGLPSTVRQRRGVDIAAGCGQLRKSTSIEDGGLRMEDRDWTHG